MHCLNLNKTFKNYNHATCMKCATTRNNSPITEIIYKSKISQAVRAISKDFEQLSKVLLLAQMDLFHLSISQGGNIPVTGILQPTTFV